MKHLLLLSLLVVACSKKGGDPADDEKARRMISACKAADAVNPKSLGDAEMREFLSNHMTVCAAGCDAKDAASCASIDHQVENLCRVSQEVCAALCDPTKPGSLTDAACKRKK
jgi:Tfp pilus assembly protein PilV